MKILQHICFIAFTVSCCFINAQEKEVIRLGVKNKIPTSEIEQKISNNNYNFVDAFEYELAKLLINYAHKRDMYNLEVVQVGQSEKLDNIRSGDNIDALLYTFSQTSERVKNGIKFSIPYFQNKAIGIIVNNEKFDINDIKNSTLRIGYVSNTTTEKELLNLYEKYKENTILSAFDNHDTLILALKNKSIDAAAGDVSRLIYDVNEGDFYFGGNLPTKRSKIRDNYCFGISPKKPHLTVFFNEFIKENQEEISLLERKWLSTALEDAYQTHYNKKEDKLKDFIKVLSIGGLLLLLTLILIFLRVLGKKNKEILLHKENRADAELGRIASLYDAKGKASIESAQIAQIGCDFFKTAKKITYVGSGGFLSDKNLGEEWYNAMHDFLQRPDTSFERVVDLPQMEVNSQSEIMFSQIYNFIPKKLEPNYISRYIKWLCIQYSNLKTYDTLEIIDSRGAALWGHGIVIMIKDEIEVLIFTTNRNTKIGSSIRDERLAKEISKIIFDVKLIGQTINTTYLADEFFNEDPRLTKIKKMIDDLNGKDLTKEILREIDITCKRIEESNQRSL